MRTQTELPRWTLGTWACSALLTALALPACVDQEGYAGPALPYEPSLVQPAACLPNLDGRIDASELVAAIGVPARFRVSAADLQVPVDVAGHVGEDGQRVWDWSERRGTDRLAVFTAEQLTGRWYAAHFEGDAFALALDAAGEFDAIYRRDDQGLWLLGTASHAEKPQSGQTLLVYAQPVAILRFPLEKGRSWKETGKVSDGLLYGLPWIGEDTYEVSVDATGRLELPDVTLTQAHRVRTQVTITPAIGPQITERQVSFVFECLGEVARARSLKNEKQTDFQTAAEVRRLGL